MSTTWSYRYSQRTQAIKSSIIRELLKLAQKPDLISFAGGLPAPELFPVPAFKAGCERILSTPAQAAAALQYSTTEGYPPLRELIARLMQADGLHLTLDNVMITSGSQQTLDLIGKLLINAGDYVLAESPTYLGALQAFGVYGPEYVTIPDDDNGLQTDYLAETLKAGPKFAYVMPNFQNPAGLTLSLDRRHTLVAFANQYGLPLVEDDPYGQLYFEGERLPTLIALDSQQLGTTQGYATGNVIYTSTFSKLLAPGLRLGWIAGPPEVISKLVQFKQGADLHTSSFTQMLAYEAARDGQLEQHILKIRATYHTRRDVMLEALTEFFPPEVTWTRPAGGMFLWVSLPAGLHCHRLFEAAIAQNVAFVPGDCFYAVPDELGFRHMRLNYSNMQPDLIVEGIRRLSVAIRQQMAAAAQT